MAIATTTEKQACLFSNARRADGAVATGGDNFQYRDLNCTTTVQWFYTTTTASSSEGYNGPSFHEWLFVAGVFIFFISFLVWSKISFTKES